MNDRDRLSELAERNGYGVIRVKEMTPLEKINSIGYAIETRKRLEEERRNKPMTKADKIRLKNAVDKFYKDMDDYLDNISYK
jgi:hypothetical protein